MTDVNVHDLIRAVQNSFQSGVPNGFVLGWNPDRLFDKFKMFFSEYCVFNCTDFNYSFCNRFEIEPAYQGDVCYTVTAKFSFIAPVYSVHSTKYWNSKSEGCVVPETEDSTICFLTQAVCEFAKKEGFVEFVSEMNKILVEGVALELSEDATLGKCLFEDYE
jgi:hypothetical protein